MDNQLVWTGSAKTGDIWLNPQEPYSEKQYDGADWQDFNDVVLLDSSVTVGSGVITALNQPTYNYNGIGLNQSSATNRENITTFGMPDYNRGVALTSTQTFVPPTNGYIIVDKTSAQYITGNVGVFVIDQESSKFINIMHADNSQYLYGMLTTICPVVKNKSYQVRIDNLPVSMTCNFYPVKGEL